MKKWRTRNRNARLCELGYTEVEQVTTKSETEQERDTLIGHDSTQNGQQ